ncbi:SNW domain-containing protein 1 [Tanacetum coccineum]
MIADSLRAAIGSRKNKTLWDPSNVMVIKEYSRAFSKCVLMKLNENRRALEHGEPCHQSIDHKYQNTLEWFKYKRSKPQDFGDGGAFSEIHYAQYPLDMGRKKDSNSGLKTLPVLKDDEMDYEEDNDKQKEIEETTEQTKAALEKIYPMSILLTYIYFPM